MIQHGDFVKLHYTGTLQDGTVFDTTDPTIAKAHNLGTRRTEPITVCVGERMLLPGLDDSLIGKTPGKYTITLKPEAAFGMKDPKRLRIIPTKQLLQQEIRPHPGLQLNIDGDYGVVRTVSPGRTVVDFNHPLASQAVTYTIQVIELVHDPAQQAKALISAIGLPILDVAVTGTSATIKVPQIYPKPMMDALTTRITEKTSITTVHFEQGEAPKKHTNTTSAHTA